MLPLLPDVFAPSGRSGPAHRSMVPPAIHARWPGAGEAARGVQAMKPTSAWRLKVWAFAAALLACTTAALGCNTSCPEVMPARPIKTGAALHRSQKGKAEIVSVGATCVAGDNGNALVSATMEAKVDAFQESGSERVIFEALTDGGVVVGSALSWVPFRNGVHRTSGQIALNMASLKRVAVIEARWLD